MCILRIFNLTPSKSFIMLWNTRPIKNWTYFPLKMRLWPKYENILFIIWTFCRHWCQLVINQFYRANMFRLNVIERNGFHLHAVSVSISVYKILDFLMDYWSVSGCFWNFALVTEKDKVKIIYKIHCFALFIMESWIGLNRNLNFTKYFFISSCLCSFLHDSVWYVSY